MKKTTCYYLFLLILLSCNQTPTTLPDRDWDNYQGNKASNQYSNLTAINTENVSQLTPVLDLPLRRWRFSQSHPNPVQSPDYRWGFIWKFATSEILCTGCCYRKRDWKFDPFANEAYKAFGMGVSRGIAFWTDGQERRLLVTAGSFLYCLNAATGKLFENFGKAGKVDLHEGLDRDVSGLFVSANTPGIVYKDKLILGTRVSEALGMVPGHIRAYNVKSGAIEWVFHTIPQPGEEGYDTWPPEAYKYTGGANSWSGLSLDEKRGMVFVPTGSASFDFYGGDRYGQNLFANCLIALNAETGITHLALPVCTSRHLGPGSACPAQSRNT